MQRVDFNEYWTLASNPSRIVLAVAEYEGKRSICPLGWKMNTSFDPPMMAISVAPTRFTHDLIANSGEFVLAWPGQDLAQAVLLCGTNSGANMDKFTEANLIPAAGEFVKAPLIAECVMNMECRVTGSLTTGDHTIFAGEVLAVWAHDEPQKVLCSVGQAEGYEVLLATDRYRFGVVKG